jgi:hypothetical protein
MKKSAFVSHGLIAVAVFILASALSASAQTPLSPTISSTVVSLTSFDPASPVHNPTYPVPITLRHTVTGSPTQYRFSRFSDFHDAKWLPYVAAPVAQIPASWFKDMTPPARPNVQVLLYFQVRAKNPNAGRPVSRVTNELTGKTTVETEPEFLQSKSRSKTILVVFFG